MNMRKGTYYIIATVNITLLMIVACRQGGKTNPTSKHAAGGDTISKKDSVSRKWKYHTVQKLDTGTAILLDTVIKGQSIVISRKGDTAEDYIDFSVSGKKLRIPQGGHRGADLYPGIIDITDPALTYNYINWRNGLLMATFDRIFSQGELYAIRSVKGGLKTLTFRGGVSVISYNGTFFVDPARKHVVCFGPVDPDKKLTSMEVYSIGESSFRYTGSFDTDTQEYYEVRKPVVIKAYLKWEAGR
jgi:hypothetical protein